MHAIHPLAQLRLPTCGVPVVSDRQERIWRCDCGAGHFLSIQHWDKMAEAGSYLQPEDPAPKMWRTRLRVAREVLRYGHAETSAGVLLNPETCREIAAALLEIAEPPPRHLSDCCGAPAVFDPGCECGDGDWVCQSCKKICTAQ
jgi:hypothetical protein